ncbi:DUF3084 domain-containing protein [Oceanithermus sp.]
MSLWTLIVGLVLLAALVAYVGDVVGRRVGRRHWRLFGLRPRATALLIAVFTGVLIALMAIAAFFFLDTDARKTILEAEQVRQERNHLRDEVKRLQRHVQEFEARAARALGKTEQLERELSAKAEALKHAEEEIDKLQSEKKQLQTEKNRLQTDIEDARKALQEREVELSQVRAEVERVKAERDSLEKEFDILQENQVSLLNDLAKLKQAELDALARAEEAQTKSKEASKELEKAKEKVRAIQNEISSLEEEKQQLLGDIATLDAERKALEDQKRQLQATNRNLQDELAAAKLEIFNLKQDLLKLGQERNAMEQGLEVLSRQLSQSLKDTVLAEVAWREGSSKTALERTVHEAEIQARAEGFRGVLVPEGLPTKDWRPPGVIQARAEGVSLDGKVLLQIRFVPRQRRFAIGQVIAVRELPPPRYQPERTRRALEDLREAAYERLLKSGVLPEKVARSGLSGVALADFQALISDETSNVVAAVVAADDIWTTETPQLIYQILYVP